ncbi:LysR family transcriptional regulator [Massilia sp. R2A-15]|uniref:LysR family transcriptional regulator n=1 Tax=Massilia sp. R2A-15 TaxID=3064278 RepID=UPI002734ACB4|nr:LysR family transcriptional regulator [Massilia sp. R2A-15]WLI87584.1 LysR family transcriptional regulator [Massilia sp. R2A-15]
MNRLRFDLDDLQAMVAVVEQGGFRAAALALNLSQPALSRRVGKLEEALGVQLFERTTRRVALTLVGREFYGRAVEILQGVEASLHNIGDLSLSFGEVTVACVPSVAHNFLPPIMQRFHLQFPRTRLRIIDEGAHAVLNNVARGESDFGINFLGADEPGIDFEPILQERFVMACRFDHALAKRRSVTWDDIGKHPYITVAKSSGNRMVLDRARAPGEKQLVSMLEVRHVSTLLEMVKAGLGIAVVPQLAMPTDSASVLRAVALKGEGITRSLGVIRRAGRVLSPGAQHFYDMMKDAVPR